MSTSGVRARRSGVDILLEQAGAFVPEPFTAASGQEFSVKVDLDVLQEKPALLQLCAVGLGDFIQRDEVDTLVSTPTGADVLTQRIGQFLSAEVVLLDWVDKPHSSELVPRNSTSRKALQGSNRLGVIDDVFTTGGTMNHVRRFLSKESESANDRIIGGYVVFDRSGTPDYQRVLPDSRVPVYALISRLVL